LVVVTQPPKDTTVVAVQAPPVVVVDPARFAGAAEPAELPRAQVDVTMPVTARRVPVPNGWNLQDALNGALPGDELVLAQGASYTGNFALPPNAGSGWIVVRSDSVTSPLGTRVHPGVAARLAKLVTPNGQLAPWVSTGGVARWRLAGLEVAAWRSTARGSRSLAPGPARATR
jgi:hypothetical protein